jgi:hypothetical protein
MAGVDQAIVRQNRSLSRYRDSFPGDARSAKPPGNSAWSLCAPGPYRRMLVKRNPVGLLAGCYR